MNNTVVNITGNNVNVVNEYDAMEAWGLSDEQMEDAHYKFTFSSCVDEGVIALYPLGYLIDIVFDLIDDDNHDKNVELNIIHRNDYFIVEG